MEYPIIILYDEQDWYFAQCPWFDGCYTQGESLEEVLANMKEIIPMCEKEQHNTNKNRSVLLTYTKINEWKTSKIYR